MGQFSPFLYFMCFAATRTRYILLEFDRLSLDTLHISIFTIAVALASTRMLSPNLIFCAV